ncbi:hypothetical protein SAMN04490244_11388 [Tranquillimonas rosea]|uniref:Uncharacterized protein n=1 Tax=Tranquillimonas rosea TaxID=641238 RepID=A0A1H9WWL4_9RHOB|nr:hypothetical protein SAMN04490244_11388 [Tranquillimonas rosea]
MGLHPLKAREGSIQPIRLVHPPGRAPFLGYHGTHPVAQGSAPMRPTKLFLAMSALWGLLLVWLLFVPGGLDVGAQGVSSVSSQ